MLDYSWEFFAHRLESAFFLVQSLLHVAQSDLVDWFDVLELDFLLENFLVGSSNHSLLIQSVGQHANHLLDSLFQLPANLLEF